MSLGNSFLICQQKEIRKSNLVVKQTNKALALRMDFWHRPARPEKSLMIKIQKKYLMTLFDVSVLYHLILKNINQVIEKQIYNKAVSILSEIIILKNEIFTNFILKIQSNTKIKPNDLCTLYSGVIRNVFKPYKITIVDKSHSPLQKKLETHISKQKKNI